MAAVKGDVIRRARLRKGLTQQEVAEQCKALGLPMDDSRIAKIELGNLGCSPRVLPILTKVVGLSVDDVLPPVSVNGDDPERAA